MLGALLELRGRFGSLSGKSALHDDKLDFTAANNVLCHLKQTESGNRLRSAIRGVPSIFTWFNLVLRLEPFFLAHPLNVSLPICASKRSLVFFFFFTLW